MDREVPNPYKPHNFHHNLIPKIPNPRMVFDTYNRDKLGSHSGYHGGRDLGSDT